MRYFVRRLPIIHVSGHLKTSPTCSEDVDWSCGLKDIRIHKELIVSEKNSKETQFTNQPEWFGHFGMISLTMIPRVRGNSEVVMKLTQLSQTGSEMVRMVQR